MNDEELRRSVLWHRLISEIDYEKYFEIKTDDRAKKIEWLTRHWNEMNEMSEKCRRFSESNPESINDADADIKDILVQTMPKFLKKYPQYKGDPCIASDD